MLSYTLFLFSIIPLTAHAAPVTCKDCNVVLIAMDALQAAHVSHLGYSNQTTTNLDALAKTGVSFTQAISPASWTVPTYLSVFSSQFPSQHGLTNRYLNYSKSGSTLANFKQSRPNLKTMAQLFQSAGYRTGGFTGDSGVSAILGYDLGFEKYTDEIRFGGMENSAKHALEWLDGVKGQKFFLFLHGYDSHGQFSLPDGYKSRFSSGEIKMSKEEQARLRELGLSDKPLGLTEAEVSSWRGWYDGKISDADRRLGAFLGELERRGLRKNTIVVVFSDHGTEFYEHEKFDHGHTLYDELIHVPFVIADPKGKAGVKVLDQVSTLDLLPTILDLTGIKGPKGQMQGRSLANAVHGRAIRGADVYSETDYRNYTHKRSVRTADGWKYILTIESGKEELYNLTVDPSEKRNLAEENAPRARKLRGQLMRHLKSINAYPRASGGAECLPAYQGQCD